MSIKEIVEKAKEHFNNFEDVTEVLPPFTPKHDLDIYDLLVVGWGSLGCVCLGYALGLLH